MATFGCGCTVPGTEPRRRVPCSTPSTPSRRDLRPKAFLRTSINVTGHPFGYINGDLHFRFSKSEATQSAVADPNERMPGGYVYLIRSATSGAHARPPAPTGGRGTLHHMGLPALNDFVAYSRFRHLRCQSKVSGHARRARPFGIALSCLIAVRSRGFRDFSHALRAHRHLPRCRSRLPLAQFSGRITLVSPRTSSTCRFHCWRIPSFRRPDAP